MTAEQKKQRFIDWAFKSQSGPKKMESIKAYASVLSRISSIINKDIGMAFFDIETEHDFYSVRSIIEGIENYEQFNRDYQNMIISASLNLFERFIKTNPFIIEWFPSLKEYSPGFSKDQWLDLLNNPIINGPVWGSVLAMFFTEKDGATCSALGKKFNRNPSSISGTCIQLAKRIHSETSCPLHNSEDRDRYWPILFLGRKQNESNEAGVWVWKLRPELYEALEEFGILRFLSEGDAQEMPVHEAIDCIKKYIAGKGFTYDEGLIANFYLSLKSKPFVILAGTSGTGKTKLVKLFAEAIGATAENGRYKLVPVRPDWSDSTDLFGHVDLNSRFHAGAILDFLKEAESHPDKPYFLCLDEMNLARVEYYLSDILSVIETREKTEDGRIVSAPLLSEENYGGDADAAEKYGTVRFPENLCLIGTVNMDETTFPFSKKVLDRANTIEFSQVDLVPDFETFETNAQPVDPGKLFLKPEYLQISHCKAQREYVHTVCEELQELNGILMAANAHVGYRVRDEICFYMLNNKNSGLLPEETAMDYEIMQKILPRIQGSSSRIREMLFALFRFCAGDYSGYDASSDHESMHKYLQSKGAKCRRSAEKIISMVRRFDEDGFTSYWI